MYLRLGLSDILKIRAFFVQTWIQLDVTCNSNCDVSCVLSVTVSQDMAKKGEALTFDLSGGEDNKPRVRPPGKRPTGAVKSLRPPARPKPKPSPSAESKDAAASPSAGDANPDDVP